MVWLLIIALTAAFFQVATHADGFILVEILCLEYMDSDDALSGATS